MKKLITRLLTLALSLIMVFGLVSCNKKKDPVPPEMVSLKTVAENAIDSMLASDYINITLTGKIVDKNATDYSGEEELAGVETRSLTGNIYLKAIENDFNVVLKTKSEEIFDYNDEGIDNATSVYEQVSYKVDGKGVEGSKTGDNWMYDSIYDAPSITDVLAEAGLTLDDIGILGGALVGALNEGKEVEKSNNGYTWTKTVDLAPKLNSLAKFIRDNAEKTVGEILMTLSGKTQAEIEAAIDAAFVAGLTVETAIPKLEKLLLDVTGETITIKGILDDLQTYTGLTAKDIVEYINDIAKASNSEEVLAEGSVVEEDLLPAPADGQSLYDYILNFEIAEGQKIKDMSIDALVSGGEEGVTLASVVPMIKAMLFAPAADSEVEDTSLKFSDLLQAENQIATILNSISALDFNKLSASVTISVGADGKLSGVSVKADVKVSTYVATEGEEAVVVVDGSIELGIAITYTQPVDVVFAIPEEAKEVA